MITISFPGGAGGHWLISVINFHAIKNSPINFHTKNTNSFDDSEVKLLHELDPTKFDYLLSGKLYFNFYINVIYKLYYCEMNFFNRTSYKIHFLECINTARFICNFDKIHNNIFFNFDDLATSPDKFYNKLIEFQDNNNFNQTEYTDFLIRQQQFKNTCVNAADIYENFDNMIWVCFVIGQLMNLNIVPYDFVIFEEENQEKCIKFAIDNYYKCLLTDVHYFDNRVCLPKLLAKLN